MNLQSHMSGQISGQVPNQGGTQFSGLPQQNIGVGGAIPSQMQNMVFPANPDHDGIARRIIREKITQYMQRHPITNDWLQRLPDIVRRVDDWLYKISATKEDYMNFETLERRLHAVVRNLNNQSVARRVSSSSSVSTMIPTPGMGHTGSTNLPVTCSADSSMVANSGTVVSTSVGAGQLSDGYHQTLGTNSFGSSGNIIVPSVSVSRGSSQMIPTPGLNNSQPLSVSAGGNGGIGYSGVESTVVSQQQHQKQLFGTQNNHMLQSFGGQLGVGLRPNMQNKHGLAVVGNNSQLGTAVSEGYNNASAYNASSRPMQQCFEQQNQSLSSTSLPRMVPMSGDACMMNDLSYGVPTQNMNPMSMQTRAKINVPTSQTYQPSLQSIQQDVHKTSILDHSQKMDFQSQARGIQSHQNIQKFQQQPNQSYPQYSQQEFMQQQKQQNHQQQLLRENDTFRQSLLPSNLNSQLMTDHAMESHNETLLSQVSDEYHLSDLTHFQQNNVGDVNLAGTKLVGQLSGSQNMRPSISRCSQQIHQIFHPNQQSIESQNDFYSFSTGSHLEAPQQGQWHSQPLQKTHASENSSFGQHIQDEFQQRILMQDEAQRPQLCIEGSVEGQASSVANGVTETKQPNLLSSNDNKRIHDYKNQRRWLLFLRHACHCSAPKGKCQEVHCILAQQLLAHMKRCNLENCSYPRCQASKRLIKHHHNCTDKSCPVCVYVREFVAAHRKQRLSSESGSVRQVNGSWKAVNDLHADKNESKSNIPTTGTSFEQLQTPLKRIKVEHPMYNIPKNESSSLSVSETNQLRASDKQPMQGYQPGNADMSAKIETADVVTELQNHTVLRGVDCTDDDTCGFTMQSDLDTVASCFIKKQENAQIDKDQPKVDVKSEANALSIDPVSGKSGKPKIKGVSMTELFTPEQVRQHIIGLRQWVGQSKAKAEKNQAMEHSMSENSCQLCAVEKLTFEPPPIYCTPCGARIKRNAMYYTCGNSDTRHYICIPCHNEARGDSIEVEGTVIPKLRLDKKRNDEETEEWWVQCDKCEAWQHQICALFNGRRNDGGQAEYTCPNCYVQEIERGERKPLPQSAVLGADDLPRTILSDHLEQRLFRRLKQERQERARHLGKAFDEVPGAEALVIRVVSSVDKKLEVKPRFLEIFQEENYPTEFPYKSKVILLFQKIQGVEVCLFGMYVQEFGSECQFPNQRRVYLSYLDSVKYFRPEIRTVTGEALRTFVYHEILIGYLEYCKRRGFTSCYIWACPPLKGEDYILYCHPEIQKTPKSDKLREWYLSMLRKAMKENIVADLTNLYDHFFVTVGECKAKVTAARLPYFDGDYWPGAAEDMINQLQQEEDGRKQQKKGKTKKTITKRQLKAAGQADLSGNPSKDAMLMQKLGETIYPMKEDFIMVHLQHACTHCCLLMVCGIRWVCNQCKNFQLCEKCYDGELGREERERHPVNGREKHLFHPVEINDVPSDTRDQDEILESEFFDTRQAFLSLCQGNHYQYDTLRRAKHSSMMVLYHLHNPTAPAFVTTCNVCHHDIEAGQGWRCEVCPDFDVCNGCYQKDSVIDHPHKLTNHPSNVDAQNTEARQKRVLQLRKMLDLLVHASKCRVQSFSPAQSQCQYPNCRKVKGLFRHGRNCKVRASGGCVLCKKMWYLLQLHARACKESECSVPRCKDLKEHLRRLQQQSDSRRRAAVAEMMRQRAAEVAGGSG